MAEIKENQLKNTLDTPVIGPKELIESATEEVEEGIVFETSGRTGSSKQIPCQEVDYLRTVQGEGFALAGLKNETVLNLCAPLPHMSSWVVREGMCQVGGRVVNQHFKDYRSIFENDKVSNVTAITAVPSVGVALGREIADTYAPPTELFPNLEKISVAGGLVTDSRRQELINIWGVDDIRESYASSETGIIASAIDDTRKLVPLLHRFILEIIPDDSSGEIVDIRNFEKTRQGSLLITDPARTAVNLNRYRIGDKISVHPTENIPRIKILGREDNSINLSGALLYPSQIHEAVGDTFGPDTDWVARVSEPDFPAIDFYIIENDLKQSDRLLENLFNRNSAVKQAYHDVGVIEYLDVHYVPSRDDIAGITSDQGMKQQHIVIDDSYQQ